MQSDIYISSPYVSHSLLPSLLQRFAKTFLPIHIDRKNMGMSRVKEGSRWRNVISLSDLHVLFLHGG